MLRDPHQVLQGDGSQVRYVRFHHKNEIKSQIISPLIKEALEVAALTKEEKQDRFLQLEAEMDARSFAAEDENNLP